MIQHFSTKQSNKKKAKQTAVDGFHNRVHDFITCNGLSDLKVECSHFRRLIEYTIDNASDLKGPENSPTEYPHMSRRKLVAIQCTSFENLMSKVRNDIKLIRKWYIDKTGGQQPFITVASDVWDKSNKKILGMSIIYTNPITCETYYVPIALLPPSAGEKAIELGTDCLLGLERVGVTYKDIHRSVNDNCSTAVKTGRM